MTDATGIRIIRLRKPRCVAPLQPRNKYFQPVRCCLSRIVSPAVAIALLLLSVVPALSQKSRQKTVPKPAPIKRLPFAAAQKLLVGEEEGNLQKQMTRDVITYSLTRFISGQVLELYYPVTSNMPSAKGKTAAVPGYGIWYENDAVYRESKRPRHALEDLVPNTNDFIAQVPQLITRLEKRLRARLDYSRASLRRLDALVAQTQGILAPTETDPKLFQELLAYYGETLRQALAGEWKPVEDRYGKNFTHNVPGLRYLMKSVNQFKTIQPGVSVMNAMFDEKNRGTSVTLAFDRDLAATR